MDSKAGGWRTRLGYSECGGPVGSTGRTPSSGADLRTAVSSQQSWIPRKPGCSYRHCGSEACKVAWLALSFSATFYYSSTANYTTSSVCQMRVPESSEEAS